MRLFDGFWAVLGVCRGLTVHPLVKLKTIFLAFTLLQTGCATYLTASYYGSNTTHDFKRIPAKSEIILGSDPDNMLAKVYPARPFPKKIRKHGRGIEPIYLKSDFDISPFVKRISINEEVLPDSSYFFYKDNTWVLKSGFFQFPNMRPRLSDSGLYMPFYEISPQEFVQGGTVYTVEGDFTYLKRNLGKTIIDIGEPVIMGVALVFDLVTLPFQFIIATAGS